MKINMIKRWLPLGVMVVIMVAVYVSGLHEKISLQVLQDNKESLLNAVAARPFISALGFMALYIAFVALSLPAATLLTLTGGFLFGTWMGTLYVVTGATIGATVLFFIAKTALGTVLREKAGGLYRRVEGNMQENAVGYLMFMRLVPIFPFFLVNIVPALFDIKPRVFILTTFFGIIPGSFVFVNLGKQLANIESLNDLVSMQTLMAFALLGFFALIPALHNQVKKRKAMLSLTLVAVFSFSQSGYADGDYQQFLTGYDGLLKSYITHERTKGIDYNGVDYDGWHSDPTHKAALKILLAQHPEEFENDARKAFWVNVYNFLTVELILREGERTSIKNLGRLFSSPWKAHTWSLGGKDYTLDYIEHKILRPMGDARVHFAINCASLSCPDLRSEAYREEKLNNQFDEQVMRTLDNQGKGFKVENNTIYISKIFDWFSDDFSNGDVKTWLGNYKQVNQKYNIEFMDYDWSLNKAK
jgi:uncharacterized membrane protein YdjX (TVP38/TMEM64 family)|tara:strand:+ start:196978 stop:198396 length:1419 start_codon:yes stop_codon:yes gene_type:complete